MNISARNLIPEPLVGTDQSGSGLWLNKQIDFLPKTTNLTLSASGRGKSSLISFIYGTRKDYQGELLFDSIPVKNFNFMDWTTIRKTKLSIVFQDLRLFDKLSAFENIQLKNLLTQFHSENEIIKMAEQLEVEKLLVRPVYTLSYGQQQRIAIIRSLCQPMSFLLLDEPFSHLDRDNIKKAWNLISDQVTNQNAGIILTLLNTIDFIIPQQTINI